MKTLYLISDSLDSLERDKMNQSSQKYEFDLATHLSMYATVKVLSSKLERSVKLESDNIELLGIRDADKSKYAGIREIIDSDREDKAIIFWGYDLRKVISLLNIKFTCKVKCFPFVYDSHKIAIKDFKIVKKFIAQLYFCLGKFLLRFFDGFILFQDKAAERLRIKNKPYLVIKPGVNRIANNFLLQSNEDFLVTYCGTLTHLNGIDALVDSFKYFVGSSVEFMLCGTGPLLGDVIEAEKKYDFVKYGGLINEEELKLLYSRSSLLLNLRRLDDEAMDFAFPSKIFECISSGVPVLTTKVLEDQEFLDNTYVLEEVSAESIVNKINYALKDKYNAADKAQIVRNFIEDKYSFDKSANEVIAFINEI